MSGGYAYGDPEPVEECGCCGGEARAEHCDVGIGYAQISEFVCVQCGASPEWNGGAMVWVEPDLPSGLGQRVTGYHITASGHVFETTFDQDHEVLYRRMRTSRSEQVSGGAVRITNLEGFAVDLPPFMSARAKRALSRVLKKADWSWGDPYVMRWGENRGEEMTRSALATAVSLLPEGSVPPAESPSP